MRRLLPVLACLTIVASFPAAAAEATPEETAAASAEADRLIAKAGAADQFENASINGVSAVRHKGSGMVCLFGPREEANSISIIASGLPRGDDVACGTTFSGQTVTLYATRYPDGMKARASLEGANDAIRQHWGAVKPFVGEIKTPSFVGQPEIHVAAFLAERDGRKLYTQVATADVGPWVLKLRVTGAEDAAPESQRIGGGLFGYALEQAVKNPGDH